MDTTEIDDLKTRYARQMSLPEVGEEGQMRLAGKRVAIIGAGGLGSALLPLLVGAGVGHLTLCDDDSISVSNLPRQTLYTTHEVGRSKAHCAAERLRAANPHCDITAYSERLTEANATRLIGEVDLLIDATDNEATRLLLDLYASEHHIPWLYASLEGWCGQLALFLPDSPSRYLDLFPEGDEGDEGDDPSPTQAPFPVMATTPTVIGSIAATEALKLLLGLPSPLTEGLLLIDSLQLSVQLIRR